MKRIEKKEENVARASEEDFKGCGLFPGNSCDSVYLAQPHCHAGARTRTMRMRTRMPACPPAGAHPGRPAPATLTRPAKQQCGLSV